LDQFPLGLLLAVFAVLLVFSGFFSIAETSMMALNRYRLRHLVKQGHRSARMASELLAHTDRLLGVLLLGQNLINAACATLATVITVAFVGEGKVALGLGTIIVTFFILVFSEITPKVIGARYPEPIALVIVYALRPLLTLFYPVVWFVNLFVRALLWMFRIQSSDRDANPAITMEELRTLVLEGAHYIPPKHQNILLNLFALENITVDDVMRPRSQIEGIDIAAPIDEIKDQLATSNHTLLPVYEDQLDNIVGIVHVRRVLHQSRDGELTKETLRQIVRPPYFVPAGTPLLTQLQHFQESRRRVGIVVDEYGELQGLVHVEDILEEIVGEFHGQSTSHVQLFRVQADNTVLAEGSCPLRELNRKLGMRFPVDGPKTLNGLVLEHLEDIPEAGTTVRIAGYRLEIVQTQDRMVKSVRIYPDQLPLDLSAA
jgi:Mg2+/Co2+ transporter CorB